MLTMCQTSLVIMKLNEHISTDTFQNLLESLPRKVEGIITAKRPILEWHLHKTHMGMMVKNGMK